MRARQRRGGTRPVLLRRSASASDAHPRVADQRRDAGPRRADQLGRRPHRGPYRGSPGRRTSRPDHRGDDREPAAARPGRRRDPADGWQGFSPGHAQGADGDQYGIQGHRHPGRGVLMALTTEPVTRVLPIADMASVRLHARGLLREHRATMTTVIGLHALAALAALVAPRLVGELVDGVTHGTTRSQIDTLVIWLAASVLLQTVLMWAARRASLSLIH